MSTAVAEAPTVKREIKPPPARQPKPLPAPNGDFYALVETLPAEDLAVRCTFGDGLHINPFFA
jgi:hypothetical protein